jgi:hypothetical protein
MLGFWFSDYTEYTKNHSYSDQQRQPTSYANYLEEVATKFYCRIEEN